jgi:outer membrane immunogenic protein
MSHSLSFGVAFAYVLTGAISAQAADLSVPSNQAPIYKARAPLPFSWTGLYLGINGGYAMGRSNWSDPAVGTDSGKFNTSGGLVGAQETGAVVSVSISTFD